jgi:hypothetical protein
MLESLARLSPHDVMGYAKVGGWQQFRTTGRLMIFNRNETGSLDQLPIPVDFSRPDFAERMREAVERLVEFEKRPAPTIVSDLMSYDSDLLRFRVTSSRAQKRDSGAIPNCVYKNRELCWGIRGLVSAFSFAGHLLGVPVPCAELMTAFV